MIFAVKLIGIAVLFVSVSAYGFYRASSIELAEKRIVQYISCITELKCRILYEGSEILTLAESVFGDLPLIVSENGRIHTADCGIGESERKILDDYFLKLGTTERQGEVSRAEMCVSLLNERHLKIAEQTAKKAKLYRVLGICGGLFGCIIFL